MKILTQDNEEFNLKDFEKLKCDSICNTDKLADVTSKLQGAKLVYLEPITDGLESKEIKGLLMYFILPNGEQKIIECTSGDMIPDKLYVSLYQ